MQQYLMIIMLLLPSSLLCAGKGNNFPDRKQLIQELEIMLTEHPTPKEELGILSNLHTQYKLYTESLELSLKKCEKKAFSKADNKSFNS